LNIPAHLDIVLGAVVEHRIFINEYSQAFLTYADSGSAFGFVSIMKPPASTFVINPKKLTMFSQIASATSFPESSALHLAEKSSPT